MAEGTPPDSPHVRSGVSSFSHISSPASYQFSRDGDASDEEGSNWSSDEVSTPCTSPILHDNSATGAHYTTDSNTRSAKMSYKERLVAHVRGVLHGRLHHVASASKHDGNRVPFLLREPSAPNDLAVLR